MRYFVVNVVDNNVEKCPIPLSTCRTSILLAAWELSTCRCLNDEYRVLQRLGEGIEGSL